MKKLTAGLLLSFMTSPVLAGTLAGKVPEMSAGAGVAAIALVVGAIAIMRERNKK